jgi:N-acetylgalactosamine 4-sulfate 6-O-sulfotransferase
MQYMLNNKTFSIKAQADAMNAISFLQSIISTPINNNNNYSLCWDMDFILKSDNTGRTWKAVIGNEWINVDANFINDPRNYYKVTLQNRLNEISNVYGLCTNTVCIPRVFLAGFPKCGSSELDSMLTLHPSINHGLSKEPRWWSPPLINPNTRSFKSTFEYLIRYLLHFQMQPTIHNDVLLLDASPNLFKGWSNMGYDEEYEGVCLLPTVMSTIIPNAQFIVIMRNPIDYLYSNFWYRCSSIVFKDYNLSSSQTWMGPFAFHAIVQYKISQFNKCLQHYPQGKCILEQYFIEDIYPFDFPCGKVPLGTAIYYLHIIKWFSVYPKSNFFFVKSEEFFQSPITTTRRIWDFLNLPPPSQIDYALVTKRLSKGRNAQIRYDYQHNSTLQMLPHTRAILKKFFKPFNSILSTLLNSEQFMWNETGEQ